MFSVLELALGRPYIKRTQHSRSSLDFVFGPGGERVRCGASTSPALYTTFLANLEHLTTHPARVELPHLFFKPRLSPKLLCMLLASHNAHAAFFPPWSSGDLPHTPSAPNDMRTPPWTFCWRTSSSRRPFNPSRPISHNATTQIFIRLPGLICAPAVAPPSNFLSNLCAPQHLPRLFFSTPRRTASFPIRYFTFPWCSSHPMPLPPRAGGAMPPPIFIQVLRSPPTPSRNQALVTTRRRFAQPRTFPSKSSSILFPLYLLQ
ncbi:hypothetical protein C8J57DRAFT_233975 [Mycena rebaudengoi]|nr:hypothetical protein C8J57DRAFT_233975 [Mycena rebaudengoi]